MDVDYSISNLRSVEHFLFDLLYQDLRTDLKPETAFPKGPSWLSAL